MKRRLFDPKGEEYFEEHETPVKLDEEFADRGQYVSEEFVEWHYEDGRIERLEWYFGQWRIVESTVATHVMYKGDMG